MKKQSKKTIMPIIIAAIVIICLIVALVLIFGRYKPDQETLDIINEASVMLYDSEITGEYKQLNKQKTDGTTFYKFKFKLEDGQEVIFEFAKNLKETYILYVHEGDNKKTVLLNTSAIDELDNLEEWPDEWSK